MRHTSLCCSSSSAWTRETVHSARPVHPLQTLTHLQQLVFVYVCVSLLLLWARVCVKVRSNCPASLRKEVVKTACLEPKKDSKEMQGLPLCCISAQVHHGYPRAQPGNAANKLSRACFVSCTREQDWVACSRGLSLITLAHAHTLALWWPCTHTNTQG